MKIQHTIAICCAPERCFDLVRSMELNTSHIMGHKKLPGFSHGLLGLNDKISWNLKPLGIAKQCVSQVTLCDFPNLLVEEMVDGPFRSMRQEYHFEHIAGFTHHTHIIEVNTSLGFIGNTINKLFLARYFEDYLKNRHYFLKDIAEGDKWKTYLGPDAIHKVG